MAQPRALHAVRQHAGIRIPARVFGVSAGQPPSGHPESSPTAVARLSTATSRLPFRPMPVTAASRPDKLALPADPPASGRTRANCARTSASPAAVPWNVRTTAGRARATAEPPATARMERDARNAAAAAPCPAADARKLPARISSRKQRRFRQLFRRWTGALSVAHQRRPGPQSGQPGRGSS